MKKSELGLNKIAKAFEKGQFGYINNVIITVLLIVFIFTFKSLASYIKN